jgi:hypothetical protein
MAKQRARFWERLEAQKQPQPPPRPPTEFDEVAVIDAIRKHEAPTDALTPLQAYKAALDDTSVARPDEYIWAPFAEKIAFIRAKNTPVAPWWLSPRPDDSEMSETAWEWHCWRSRYGCRR